MTQSKKVSWPAALWRLFKKPLRSEAVSHAAGLVVTAIAGGALLLMHRAEALLTSSFHAEQLQQFELDAERVSRLTHTAMDDEHALLRATQQAECNSQFYEHFIAFIDGAQKRLLVVCKPALSDEEIQAIDKLGASLDNVLETLAGNPGLTTQPDGSDKLDAALATWAREIQPLLSKDERFKIDVAGSHSAAHAMRQVVEVLVRENEVLEPIQSMLAKQNEIFLQQIAMKSTGAGRPSSNLVLFNEAVQARNTLERASSMSASAQDIRLRQLEVAYERLDSRFRGY